MKNNKDKVRMKAGVLLVVWTILCMSIGSVLSGTVTNDDVRTITNDSDLKINYSNNWMRVANITVNTTWDGFVRNSIGTYWEVDGTNDEDQIQLALDELNSTDGGTVWVGCNVTNGAVIMMRNRTRLDFEHHEVTLTADVEFVNFTHASNAVLENVYVKPSTTHTETLIVLYTGEDGFRNDCRYNAIRNIQLVEQSAYTRQHNWTGIRLQVNSDSDISECLFDNIFIYGCRNAIIFEVNHTGGWINGNTFNKAFIARFYNGVWFRDPGTGIGPFTGASGSLVYGDSFNNNLFHDVKLQTVGGELAPNPDTGYYDAMWGVRNISGGSNKFESCMIWDWDVADDPQQQWWNGPYASNTYFDLQQSWRDDTARLTENYDLDEGRGTKFANALAPDYVIYAVNNGTATTYYAVKGRTGAIVASNFPTRKTSIGVVIDDVLAEMGKLTGGHIHFTAGNFTAIDDMVIDVEGQKNLLITGEGASTVLKSIEETTYTECDTISLADSGGVHCENVTIRDMTVIMDGQDARNGPIDMDDTINCSVLNTWLIGNQRGLAMQGNDDNWADGNIIMGNWISIAGEGIDARGKIRNTKILNNNIIGGGNDGEGIGFADNGIYYNIHVIGNTVTNYATGIYVWGPFNYSFVEDNIVHGNFGTGIRVKRGHFTSICGNTIYNNSLAGAGVSYGLLVEHQITPTVRGTFNRICDNIVFDFYPVQKAIKIDYQENCTVKDNILYDNSGNQILITDSVNLIVGDNIGFNTSYRGLCTILDDTTSIVVNHNMSVAPYIIIVTPRDNLTSATFWYVDTVTATQFTLHVNDDVTDDVSFYWKAEYN